MYAMLKRMVTKGLLDDPKGKINVFYAFGQITLEQYEELIEMLAQNARHDHEGIV